MNAEVLVTARLWVGATIWVEVPSKTKLLPGGPGSPTQISVKLISKAREGRSATARQSTERSSRLGLNPSCNCPVT